jgi:Holliday junction DNA helicase RuvA
MFAKLTGTLEYSSYDNGSEGVIMDVNGVGYEVFCPESYLGRIESGSLISMFIHTNVREDEIKLYGFTTTSERECFRHLISISGIGPRIGLTILSTMSVEEIYTAISMANPLPFKKVSGVGTKVAERIITELKGKKFSAEFKPFAGSGKNNTSPIRPTSLSETIAALVSLGYQRADSEKAAENASQKAPDGDTETLLKASLKELARV